MKLAAGWSRILLHIWSCHCVTIAVSLIVSEGRAHMWLVEVCLPDATMKHTRALPLTEVHNNVLKSCYSCRLVFDFTQVSNTVSYTALHWVSYHYKTYTDLHRLTPTYTDLHRLTPTYTDLNRLKPTYTDLHWLTPTYTDLHWLTLTYIELHTDLHWLTLTYIDLHCVTHCVTLSYTLCYIELI